MKCYENHLDPVFEPVLTKNQFSIPIVPKVIKYDLLIANCIWENGQAWTLKCCKE